MRFLFTTLPEPGHFHPLIPIARAVVRAGHEVAFGCAASFIPEVEAAGFQGFAVGHDQQGRHYSEDHPEWLAVPPDQRSMWMIRNLWADEWARVMVTDLLSLSQTWMPDVVVREGAEYGGCIAAEVLRIPHASVRAGRISSSYAHRHAAAEQLVRLRSERGLPPDPDMRMLHRYLYLACEPPGFHEADEPQAPTMHRLRPVVDAPGSDGGAPAWLADLPMQTTIYATLGTMISSSPGGAASAFEMILEGLRDEQVNVILTVGRTNDPAQFGPQPSHVRVERYIPQQLLLPACDLVVAHGGFGTVVGALSHGLPLVLVPMGADQFYNAECCVRLGVGQVVPLGEQRSDTIRIAVRAALENDEFRARAQYVRDEMAVMPGPEHAVELLEQLASLKEPLLA